MTQLVRITPVPDEIGTEISPLPIAEIHLGATPRGMAVVFADTENLDEVIEPMNGLAEHGYESIGADLSRYRAARPDLAAALSAIWDRCADRGWELEQVGVVGYGRGGWEALVAASQFRLGAAVSVAPTPPGGALESGLQHLSPLQTPWLGMAGALGDAAELLRCQWQCAESIVHHETLIYPTVPQQFYRDSAEAAAHAAAFDSWQRTVEWLNLRVVPRLTPRALSWRATRPSRYDAL